MADQSLTDVIVKELSGLQASRQADVLAFVRFLKIGLADTEKTAQQFDVALNQAREIAESLNITPDDIEAEINTYRSKRNASSSRH